jgi:hypothetical protein
MDDGRARRTHPRDMMQRAEEVLAEIDRYVSPTGGSVPTPTPTPVPVPAYVPDTQAVARRPRRAAAGNAKGKEKRKRKPAKSARPVSRVSMPPPRPRTRVATHVAGDVRVTRTRRETGGSHWDLTPAAAREFRPRAMQVCFLRTPMSALAQSVWLDRMRHQLVMGDFCHCEVSYLCCSVDDPTRTIRISFVVNRKRPLEIKANKSYPQDGGWVVLDLTDVPASTVDASYDYSVSKHGVGMALNRGAPCASSYCGGRVDCTDMSVLDVSFAWSRIFCGALDGVFDTLTCGTMAHREEDGMFCTELALASLGAWDVTSHLRPRLTSPAQLHDALDRLDVSAASTHYVVTGGVAAPAPPMHGGRR